MQSPSSSSFACLFVWILHVTILLSAMFSVGHGADLESLSSRISPDNIYATTNHLSTYFNRYALGEGGQLSSQWAFSLMESYIDNPGQSSSPSCRLFVHPGMPQNSVICTLPGRGSLSNEVVVLGGHLDSCAFKDPTTQVSQYPLNCIGSLPGSCAFPDFATRRAPGVDDNGSSAAALIELWRGLVTSDTPFA